MKKVFYRVLVSLFLLGVIGNVESYAQSFLMGNGSHTACSGVFESSGNFGQGGPGTPGYSNNENYVMTFCPQTAGNVVNFNFAACVLGTGDVLMVYNGNSTAAPLLATYDATNPAFGPVSAQLATNPGGCLTFHFISDGADIGNGWVATLSCSLPCQSFSIETITTNPDTSLGGFIDVCDLDTVQIEVAGIFPNNNLNYNQNNSNVNFYWSIDSVNIDTGNISNILPDSAGAFLLQVFAVDSLGCEANFNINYWVRVSTEPSFTPTSLVSDTICFGETNTLTYGATSQTWSNADSGNAVTQTFLQDGSGGSPGVYVSTITFSKFGTGATLANVADLDKIWVEMEHSFIGDLSMTISCPNGSSSVLKSFPGGGGTNMGEPCTATGPGTGIGIGYFYEWKPTANVLPTMVGYGCGCANVINPCTGGGAGLTLPANSYTPSQPLSNLVGCPLNGSWSITIVDQWGTDDGYLFEWGVDLDSSLYPNSVVIYNPGIDSMWVDTALNANTLNSTNNSIQVLPQLDSTTYCYTVNVLDGFGCTHDSTFCFFVRDMCDPVCYTPVSPVFTKNKVSCVGGSDGSILTSPNPAQIPMPWSFIFTNTAGATVHTNIGSFLPDSVGGLMAGVYNLQIIDGNGCSSYWPVNLGTVTPFVMSVAGNKKTQCFGTGCDGVANAIAFSGNPPYNYLWSSGDTSIVTTNLCAGDNFLIIEDSKGCLDTLDFIVTEPEPITGTFSLDDTICVSNVKTLEANGIGGIPPYTYDWGSGPQALNTNDVSPVSPTSFNVSISDVNNCPPSIETVHIHVRQLLGMTFNGVDTICPGDSMDLICRPFGGDSLFNYSWSDGLGNGAIANVIGGVPQFYTVTLSDGCGTPAIEDSIWIQVGGYPAIIVDINPTDTICQGERYYMSAQGIGGEGTYTYEWDNGLGFGQYQYDSPTTSTTYKVTVTDDCLTDPGYGEVHLDFGEYYYHNLIPDTHQLCDPATFVFGWDTLNPSFQYFVDYGKGFEEVIGLDSISKDLDDDGCHDIRAKLITKYGCATIKEYECLVEVLTTPIAQFDFNSHNPDVIENYVEFWDESKYAASWWWYNNDEFLDSNQNFSASFPKKGDNIIKLVVASEAGCFDSTTTNMKVQEVTSYFFPSAFTPNGDGLNDEFKIQGEGVRDEEFEITIYDRWGDIVYLGKSRDQGWNGLQNNSGRALPTGTYNYYYSLILHDGRRYGSTGTVHLIR